MNHLGKKIFLLLFCVVFLLFVGKSFSITLEIYASRIEHPGSSITICWVIIPDDGNNYEKLATNYQPGDDGFDWYDTTVALHEGCLNPNSEMDQWATTLKGFKTPVCTSEGYMNATGTVTRTCDVDSPGAYSMILITNAFDPATMEVELDYYYDGFYGATIQNAFTLVSKTNISSTITSTSFEVDALWDASCEDEIINFDLPIITSTDGLSQTLTLYPNLEYSKTDTARLISCIWILTPTVEGGRLSDGEGDNFDSVWLTVDWSSQMLDEDYIVIYDASGLGNGNSTDGSPDRSSCIHDSRYTHSYEDACYAQTSFPLKATDGSLVVIFTSSRNQAQLGELEGLQFDFSLSFQSAYCIDPYCNDHGVCTNGVCECEEGWIGTSCDLNIPVDWMCDASHYNTLDGCDCSCQAYDPDCNIEPTKIKSCNTSILADVSTSDFIQYGAIEADSGFCLFCPLPENLYTSQDYPVLEDEDGDQITKVCPTYLDCDFCDEQTGFCIDSANSDATDIVIKYCDADMDCPQGMSCLSDGTCSDQDEDDDSTTGSVSPITSDGNTCKLPFTETDWLVNEGSCVCDSAYHFDYGVALDQAQGALNLLLENNNLVEDACAYMSPYKAVITTTSEVEADCQLLRFTFSGFGNHSRELGEAYFQVLNASSGDIQLDAVSKEPVKGGGYDGETFSYCLGTGLYQLLLQDSGGNGWLAGNGTLTAEGDGFTLASGTVMASSSLLNFSVCSAVLLKVTFYEETGVGSNFTFVDESNTVVTDLLGVQMRGALPGTCTDTISYSYCLPEGSSPILTTPVDYNSEQFRFQYWKYIISQKTSGRSVLKYSGILGADWSIIASNDSVNMNSDEVRECNNSLTLDLHDYYGDGWNGYFFSLYNQSSTEALQTVSLEDGSFQQTCLNVKTNTCYTFKPSKRGMWGSEIAWKLCDQSGTFDTDLSFCVDDNGSCVLPICESSVYVNQYDSFGDGWGGYQLALYDEDNSALQTVVLVDGSEGQVCLDVETDNCYTFEVATVGQYGNEISYEICGSKFGVDTVLEVCIDQDGNCTAYTEVCLDLEMYDSYGDGWSGNYFSLYAEDDPDTALSTVTLDSGSYDDTCLIALTGQCYTFSQSTSGSYANEVSWKLCGTEGDASQSVTVCVGDDGTCYEYEESSNTGSSDSSWSSSSSGSSSSSWSSSWYYSDSWSSSWYYDSWSRRLFYESYDFGLTSQSGLERHAKSQGLNERDLSSGSETESAILATETTWCEESGCAGSITFSGLQNVTHLLLIIEVRGELDDYTEYAEFAIGEDLLATCRTNSNCGDSSEQCLSTQVQQYVNSAGELTVDYGASSDVGNSCEEYTLEFRYSLRVDWTLIAVEYTAQCNASSEELYMYDLAEDGWEGYTLSLYSADDSNTILQNITMNNGFTDSSCLDVQVNSCYMLLASSYGSDASEVYWSVCNETRTYDSYAFFCIDADGICSESCPDGSIQLDQYSLLESGWNGYYFSLLKYNDDNTSTTHIKTVTLQGSSLFRTCLDVQQDACYVFGVSTIGLSDYGIFWELIGIVGNADTEIEFCTTNGTVSTDSGCTNGFIRFEDTCFKMHTTETDWLDWEQARDLCNLEGGDLFSIQTLSKQLFGELYWFPDIDDTWIGLSDVDQEGTYVWVDGSDLTYINWNDGEPGSIDDRDCAEVQSDGLWNEVKCGNVKPFTICEVPVSYCNGSVYLEQFDTYGDGWNGYFFGIEDEESTTVQEITLDHGSYGYACLDIPYDATYTFAVSKDGMWGSEISWELCGLSGTAATEVTFSLNRLGDCDFSSSTEETTSDETDIGSYNTETCLLGSDDCSSQFPNVFVDMCDYSGHGWHKGFFALLNASASVLWTETMKSSITGAWYEEQYCLSDLETDACYGFAVHASDYPDYQAWSIPSCDIYGKTPCDLAWFCIDSAGDCREWTDRECTDPVLGEAEINFLSGCDPVSSSYYDLFDSGLFGYTNSFTVHVQDTEECENIILTVHLDWTDYGSYQSDAFFEIVNLDTGDNYDTWGQIMNMESGGLANYEFSKVFVYCVSAGSYQLYLGDEHGDGWNRGYAHVSYSSQTQNREVGSFTLESGDGKGRMEFFEVEINAFSLDVTLQWLENDGYPSEASFEILTLWGDDEDLAGSVMTGTAASGTAAYSFMVDGTDPLVLYLDDTLGDGWNGGTYKITYSFNDLDQDFFLMTGTLEEGYGLTMPIYLNSLHASVVKDITFERKDTESSWNLTAVSLSEEWHGCACASCNEVVGLLEAEAAAWEAFNISYSPKDGTQYCNEIKEDSVTVSYTDPDNSQEFILTYKKDDDGDWYFSNQTSGSHGASCYEGSTFTDCKRSKQRLWCFVDEEEQQAGNCSTNDFNNCADPYQHVYGALVGSVSGGALTKHEMTCSLIIAPNIPGPLAERTSLNVTLDILLVNGSDLTIIVYSGILAGSDILYERVFNDYVSTAGETGGQMGPEPTFVSEVLLTSTGPELRINTLLTPGSATQDVMYGSFASFVGSYETVFDVLPGDMNLSFNSCVYTFCLNEMSDDGFVVFDTSNGSMRSQELLEVTYLIQIHSLPDSIWLNFMVFNLTETETISIYDGDSTDEDLLVELTRDWFTPDTGRSAFFSNTSGYALLKADYKPSSVLLWVKAADESTLIADKNFSLTLSHGQNSDALVPKVSFNEHEVEFFGDVNIIVNAWSHLAVNFYFSQGFVEFFVNGKKAQTCKGDPVDFDGGMNYTCNPLTSEFGLASETSEGYLSIGGGYPQFSLSDGEDNPLSLQVDELMLFNEMLDTAEIQGAYYNGSLSCDYADPRLTGCYHMDTELTGFSAEVLEDASMYGNHALGYAITSKEGFLGSSNMSSTTFASSGPSVLLVFNRTTSSEDNSKFILTYESQSCHCINGECERGICICDPGFGGELCDEWIVSNACTNGATAVHGGEYRSVYGNLNLTILNAEYKSWIKPLYPAVTQPTLLPQLNCEWLISEDYALAGVDWSSLAQCYHDEVNFTIYDGIQHIGEDRDEILVSMHRFEAAATTLIEGSSGELQVLLTTEPSNWNCSYQIGYNGVQMEYKLSKTYYVAPNDQFLSAINVRTGTDDAPFRTIAKALSMASTNDIILLYPGRYYGSNNVGLQIDKSVTIRGISGAQYTILDADEGSHHFTVSSFVEVGFEGLSFRNGYSESSGSSMVVTFGHVTVTNCVFLDNVADISAAIYVQAPGMLTLVGTTFESNSAESASAVLSVSAEVTATECSFNSNEALLYGTFVSIKDSTNAIVTLSSSTFKENRANAKTSVFVTDGNHLFIFNCTFEGNIAEESTAGIYTTNKAYVYISDTEFFHNNGAVMTVDEASTLLAEGIIVQNNSILASEFGVFYVLEPESITIENGHFDGNKATSLYAVQTKKLTVISTTFSRHETSSVYLEESFAKISCSIFQNNSAHDGAAIYMEGCALGVLLEETTFLENHASDKGGAIYSAESSLQIEDSSFLQNYAEYGGSIVMYDASDFPQVLNRNSFHSDLAVKRGGSIYAITSQNITASGNDFTGCSAGDGGGGWFLDESKLNADDITMTRCTSNSQGGGLYAIAKSVLFVRDPLFTHCEAKSGGALAISSESAIDIEGGSFEHSTATDGGALYVGEKSDVKIHGGVEFAHNYALDDGGAIFLVRLQPFSIPFLVDSSFTNNSAGSTGGAMYVALCESMEMANISVISSFAEGGGAIAALASDLCINQSYFSDSFTLQGGFLLLYSNTMIFDTLLANSLAVGTGGLLYGFASDIIIYRTNFFNGTAGDGGGGIFLFNCPFHVYSSNFIGNVDPQGSGGGLYITQSEEVEMINCLFKKNSAEEGGAGLIQESNQVSILECLFEGNEALYQGAGMIIEECSELTITDSTFVNNKVVGVSNSESYGGGALKINQVSKNAQVVNSSFMNNGGVTEENATIFLDGGAIYVSYSFCLISLCFFEANIAQDGGALYFGANPSIDSRRLLKFSSLGWGTKLARFQMTKLRMLNAAKTQFSSRRTSSAESISSVEVSGSTFMHNYATSGGGAFSFEESEPDGLEENTFVNNTALYGGDYTSLPTSIAAKHGKQLERSGYAISTIHVELLDEYDQVVRGQSYGSVFCESLSTDAMVSGETSATFVEGIATFDDLVVERLPNSSVNISFSSSVVDGTSVVEITFSSCILGEVLPVSSGTCQRCEFGYFSVDPTDSYCHECPTGAACYGGSQIRALQKYWRFPNSTGVCSRNTHDDCTLTPCLDDEACLGDIMISESVRFDFQDNRKLIVPSESGIKGILDTYCWASDGEYSFCQLMLNGLQISLSSDENAVVEDDLYTELTLSEESYQVADAQNLFVDFDKTYTVYLKQDESCNKQYIGNLCASCADGYGRGPGHTCLRCPPTLVLSYLVFFLGIIAIFFIGGVMIKLQMDKSNQCNEKLSIMMKIFTSYLQLVSLFSGFDLSWPEAIIEMFDIQEIISKAGDRIISIDCVIIHLSQSVADYSVDTSVFYKKLAFFMMVPVLAVVLSGIFWLVRYIKKAYTLRKPWDYEAFGLHDVVEDGMIEADEVRATLEKLNEDSDFLRVMTVIERMDLDTCPARVDEFQEAYLDAYGWIIKENWILSVVVLLFMLHPNISSYTFHVFMCEQLETGKSYLTQDLDTECGTPEHNFWKYACGVPCVLAYTFGIPFYAFAVLHHYRNDLDNNHVKLKYGFLYSGYEQPYYFWELWVMLRKVTIISVLVFIGPLGTTLEAIAGLSIAVVASFLHLHYQPYEDDSLDRLETYSLYTTVTTLFCGLFFFSGQIGEGAFYVTVQVIILAVNISFVSFFLISAITEYRVKVVNDMNAYYEKIFAKYQKFSDNEEKKLHELHELYEEKALKQDALLRVKAELKCLYKAAEAKKQEIEEQEYELHRVQRFFNLEMKEPIAKQLVAHTTDSIAFLRNEMKAERCRRKSIEIRHSITKATQSDRTENESDLHPILSLYQNVNEKFEKECRPDTNTLAPPHTDSFPHIPKRRHSMGPTIKRTNDVDSEMSMHEAPSHTDSFEQIPNRHESMLPTTNRTNAVYSEAPMHESNIFYSCI